MIKSKKLAKFLKNIGFYHTINILSLQNPMKLREFFEKLKKNGSYYNAFYRVKEALIQNDLIEIYNSSNKIRMIKLTPKGIKFIQNLDFLMQEISEMV